MRIFVKSKELVLALLLFLACYLVLVNSFSLSGHKSAISSGSGLLANIKNLKKTGKPKELFKQIGGVIKKLGPLKMSISAMISNFTMTNPVAESPELKAINEGFEKLNERLDSLTSAIGNLDNIIELSNARSAYVEVVSSINHMYESLEETKLENSKSAYVYFAKQYEKSYKFGASNMYDSLTGSTGTFGFNLLELYKTHVKCNPILVGQFCVMGIHLINKGLAVEGAYLGYTDFGAKLQSKMDSWQIKIDALAQKCDALISVCENDWKENSMRIINEVYESIGTDNQEFADKLAKKLDEVIPQRSWLIVSYKDAGGFATHCFSTYYHSEKIWNKKDHDVTIFSTERTDDLEGGELQNFLNNIEKQRAIIAKGRKCKRNFWSTRQKRNGGDAARGIVDKIRETYMTGVVYAVNMAQSPGYAATGNTIYAKEENWDCGSGSYQLIVFE